MVVTIICLLLFVLLFFNQDATYPKLTLNSRPSCLILQVVFFTASKKKTFPCDASGLLRFDHLSQVHGFEGELGSGFELWKLGGVGLHRDPGSSLCTRIHRTRELPTSLLKQLSSGWGKNNLAAAAGCCNSPGSLPPMRLGRAGSTAEALEGSSLGLSGSGCTARRLDSCFNPVAPAFHLENGASL